MFAALVFMITAVSFSGDTCSRIDKNNLWCVWEGWSSDHIRYFCMDLSDRRAPVLAIAHWHDTIYVLLFKLVQEQIKRGSVTLFFQSLARSSNDKVIISGNGKACETHGTIAANVQLLFKNKVLSDKLSIDLHKCAETKPLPVDLLRQLARECRKSIRTAKGK